MGCLPEGVARRAELPDLRADAVTPGMKAPLKGVDEVRNLMISKLSRKDDVVDEERQINEPQGVIPLHALSCAVDPSLLHLLRTTEVFHTLHTL